MNTSRYILPTILILVSGFLYVLYVEDQYADIRDVREQIAELQRTIDNGAEIARIQAELQAKRDSLSEEIWDELTHMVPPEHEPTRVFYDLDTIAKRHELSVVGPVMSMSNSASGNAQGARVSVVQFSINGSYQVFKEFLLDLEKSIPLADIKKVTFSGLSEPLAKGREESFAYTIELELYSYGEIRQAPALAHEASYQENYLEE